MRDFLILFFAFILSSSAFAYEFGSSGADGLYQPREQRYEQQQQQQRELQRQQEQVRQLQYQQNQMQRRQRDYNYNRYGEGITGVTPLY